MKLVQASIDWPGTWGSVLDYLDSAMCEGMCADWTLQQVKEMIESGAWGLYGVVGDDGRIIGAGVVSVTVTGQRKVLEVLLFAADEHAETWVALQPDLAELARSNGCLAIRGQGRRGWARVLGARQINAWELDV